MDGRYDRYGNRLNQNVVVGFAPSAHFTINLGANQIVGFSYDAAGNMTNDGSHSYSYDADGNVLQVGGSTTANYTYDALNQRVQTVENGTNTLYAYNINGQRVASFDDSDNPISNQVYSGSTPVAFYQGGAIHYQHQDWLGTERARTSSTGVVEGTYQSLPFGDGFSASGSDNDAYHFAALDRDADDTHHAQFRQYSSTQGRWMSPDPYDGSYNPSDPQSFNRYVYVGNRPLSSLDPSGQLCVSAFPYGNAEEPYIDSFINSAEDCGAAYGIWYDSDSSITVTTIDPVKTYVNVTTTEPDPMDPSFGPGLGAIAINPSSSGGSNNGGGSSSPAPNNTVSITDTSVKSPARKACEKQAQDKFNAIQSSLDRGFWSNMRNSAGEGAVGGVLVGCIASGCAGSGPAAVIGGLAGAAVGSYHYVWDNGPAMIDAKRQYSNDMSSCSYIP